MSEEEKEIPEGVLPISTYFVREKNVLFAKANLSDLFVDFYLHLKDNQLDLKEEHAVLLKRGLAAFALHCVSRARNEVLAWTINFQDPLVNLFYGGDTETGAVVGRIYTENIKPAKENAFYQDLVRGNKPLHRSVVGFQGSGMLRAIEEFYRQSEQRPARFFELEPDVFAIVSAHPDYDREWFARLDRESVANFESDEYLSPLETRPARWFCGCNQLQILKVLAPVYQQGGDELFLGEELIEVNCPRCAGKYRITREAIEAHISNSA